jgi:hypothetical protein
MSRWITILLMPLFVAGCTRLETGTFSDTRYAVKGVVTLDGKPLTNATIAFVGTESAQRTAGGPVLDGKFEVPQERGPNAGKYRVEIRWSKPTGKKIKDSDTGAMIDVLEEGLPPRYHQNTILTATVGEKSEFDFPLVSK